MGIPVWIDRRHWQAAVPSAAAASSGKMAGAEALALLQEVEPSPPQVGAGRAQRPRGSRRQASTLPALGCYWTEGTLLLCDASVDGQEQRLLRDLLLCVAAIGRIDLGAPSQRARLSKDREVFWMSLSAAELASTEAEVITGFLRKRLSVAEAKTLLLVGGGANAGRQWLSASKLAFEAKAALDPLLATAGAAAGRTDDGRLPVLLLPPLALLLAEPKHKRALWYWLLEQLTA